MSKPKPKNLGFFKNTEWWHKFWQGMPEFNQEDLMPYKTLMVHFRDKKDMEDFSKLIDQQFNKTTKFVWYPKSDVDINTNVAYVDEKGD